MSTLNYVDIIRWLVVSAGYYLIFKKCMVKKPEVAFLPPFREYTIGMCAGKEKEGKTYAILSFISYGCYIGVAVSDNNLNAALIFAVAYMSIKLACIIYEIRIYNELVKVFERGKGWVFCWIFLEGITAVLWGFSNRFVPSKTVDYFEDMEAAKLSDIDAKALETGLTVNIKDRSIIDFFKKRYLLKDIHLTIPEGHMVLLLGGSGAGKTTFLNAVTGYEKADASILLNNKDVYREYESLKYDIGFVPQQDLMRGNDTVQLTLQDAASLRLPASVKYRDKISRVHEVLEEFGLEAIKNSLVEKLSGGQRKRLSIAMEYISDPSLFILDEPDSGLDGVVARGLFEKLRAIADSGKIVVVITHTPDRVIDLFDDVIVLAKDGTRCGRLAYYGPVKKACEFFGKESMEDILLSINQKEEGGEGRADEFVDKYNDMAKEEKEVG